MDIWAAGCIVSELAEGRPLFPGESDIDQLFLVQAAVGPMCSDHLEFFNKSPKFTGIRFPGSPGSSPLVDRQGDQSESPSSSLC